MTVVIAIEILADASNYQDERPRFGKIVSFWIAILGTHRNQSRSYLFPNCSTVLKTDNNFFRGTDLFPNQSKWNMTINVIGLADFLQFKLPAKENKSTSE